MGQFEANQTINECYLLREPSGGDPFAESWKASAIFTASQFLIRFLAPGIPAPLLEAEKALALSAYDLSHPAIASVLEADMIGGRMALVNECEGEVLLSDALSRGRGYSREESLKVVIELCRALEALRRRGIRFGTLCPSSVLVSPEPGPLRSVRLLAPGYLPLLGALNSAEAASTEDFLAYLSPEARGPSSHPVDSRSDAYSLGVLLYRLLSGALPAQARAGENERAAAAKSDAQALAKLGASPALEALILSCLRKNPSERPAGPAELVRGLLPCAEAEPKKTKKAETPKVREDEIHEHIAYFLALSLERPDARARLEPLDAGAARAAPPQTSSSWRIWEASAEAGAAPKPPASSAPQLPRTIQQPGLGADERLAGPIKGSVARPGKKDGADQGKEPQGLKPESPPRGSGAKKRGSASWKIDIMDARELIRGFIESAKAGEGFFRFVEASPSLRAFAAEALDLKRLGTGSFAIDAARPAGSARELRLSLGEAVETALSKRRGKDRGELAAASRRALLSLGRAVRAKPAPEAGKGGSGKAAFVRAAADLAALSARGRSLVLVLRLRGRIDEGLRSYLSALAELSDTAPLCVLAYYEGEPPVRIPSRKRRPADSAAAAAVHGG